MNRSFDLERILLRLYEAATDRDISFFESLISQQEGVLTIGTDPHEWWTGYEAIMKERQSGDTNPTQINIIPGQPTGFVEGSVGWVADCPTFRMNDGSEIPFRLTAVFHLEGNEWKLVQQHVSIGVPNQ